MLTLSGVISPHHHLRQCREGQVSMWNIETGEQELSFETRYGGFCKFSLLPAAGTSSEGTIYELQRGNNS